MSERKLNCWEFKNCGRGPDVAQSGRKICPAALEIRLNGIHGGENSGRACWVVAGTFCGGTAQGDFVKKYHACKRCDFYNKVLEQEDERFEQPHVLLRNLKNPSSRTDLTKSKLGVLIGGSGLIGGTLMHYFKTQTSEDIEVLSPNSKKLSLREPEDIKQYFEKYKPDFIINSAIASIDSDAQLAYEINYLGSIKLAQMAMALKIPYIHISSAATLPMAENVTEDDMLSLSADLPNYAKSKLMAERTLKHLHETRGLDYTIIRLGVVYGKHDHKIQGFHRLLFSIANQAMPFMMTRPGISHSYSNTQKIPHFVYHILDRREEFSGQTYHFVDREPVELNNLILTIKNHLQAKTPREIYIPYQVANLGKSLITWLRKKFAKVGVEIKLPAELMFLENFYKSQTLSSDKLENSSYIDPAPHNTIYTELNEIIKYYSTRWKHLNLLSSNNSLNASQGKVTEFLKSPESLLETTHRDSL